MMLMSTFGNVNLQYYNYWKLNRQNIDDTKNNQNCAGSGMKIQGHMLQTCYFGGQQIQNEYL